MSDIAASRPPAAVYGASDQDIDQDATHGAYRSELQRLGLLRAKFKKPKKGELPEMDIDLGMLQAQRLEITRLGHLLLSIQPL